MGSTVAPHAGAILKRLREGDTMPQALETLGLEGELRPRTARMYFRRSKTRRSAYDAALEAGKQARGGETYQKVSAEDRAKPGPVLSQANAVLERLAHGEFLTRIARDLGFHPSSWYRAIERKDGLRKRYEEARRIGAEEMVAEGLRILDEARPATSAEAMILKERAGYRRYLAERFDPATFGAHDPSVKVELSFGDAHMQALKELGSMDRDAIPEADYELLGSGG
jgi:hypothetical protein